MLFRSLDAREAGVELSCSASGHDWQLKMQGLHTPMPAILEHALRALETPDAPPGTPPAAPLMPIRQLLKRLPQCSQPATSPVPRVCACSEPLA